MSSARKITVKGRLVELDGDEMTRVIWKLIKDLALLIGPDQEWQHTGQFLDPIAENLDKAVAGLSG